MNGKDFFELLGDLDEDIVEDAWTEESNEVMIIEERSPMYFLKIGAAVAACVAVMAAGVYGFIKIKSVYIISPNESGSSYSESSVTESESSESSEISPISKEDAKFEALDRPGSQAVPIIPIETSPYAFVQKYDDTDFAVLYVESTNASEDKPVYITVCDAPFSGLDSHVPVSEKLMITGPGKYVVRYTKPYPADSISYLHAETCGYSYGDGGDVQLDGLVISGSWMP